MEQKHEKFEYEEDSLVFSMKSYGSHYNRSSCVETDTLSELFLKRYQPTSNTINKYNIPENIVFTASGMQAIDIAMQSIFIQNKWLQCNLIFGDNLYCDTPRLFNTFKENYLFEKLNLYPIKVEQSEQILKLFQKPELQDRLNILFLESCSNPKGEIFDFEELLPQLKKISKNLVIIVDNTWLTSSIFNPFNFQEVDIVISSLSKYYSAGNCIGGVAISRKTSEYQIVHQGRVHGIHFSPHHARLVLNSLKSMDKRIESTARVTLKVAQYLEKISVVYNLKLEKEKQPDISLLKVQEVKYSLLESHNSFKKAQKYFRNQMGPGVIIFALEGKKNRVNKYLKNYFKNQDKLNQNQNNQNNAKWHKALEQQNKNNFMLKFKTSFGGYESKIDNWPFQEEDNTWIRLAIGYNDSEEQIIKALDDFLRKFEV